MELKEMITKRKSVRSYSAVPVEKQVLDQIREFIAGAKPLYPGIQAESKIVPREQVRFYMPWKAPQLIAIFSEEKPGYLENVGFLFQQVDLYLQSIGLGACWMGLGKLKERMEGQLPFVILLAFGYPEGAAQRSSIKEFRRRDLGDISDNGDARLEGARLAPSSTNSQPWYFIHEGDVIHAYCSLTGLRRHKGLGKMNRIDMGIALAHIYAENTEKFSFFLAEPAGEVKDHAYIGSFTL